MLAYSTAQNRCAPCLIKRQKKRIIKQPLRRTPLARSQKPIRQKGKVTLTYERWRDTVARPHLDNTVGVNCALCGAPPPINDVTGKQYRHDVDHIHKRGSHSHLRMVLSNVRYLCRNCHRKETDK